jgi:hypothetical protein
MAKYLSAIYRGAYYGNPPRLIYNAEPMVATAIDYGVIEVKWNPPSGEFYKIRLVRNNDNFAETSEDGVILWEQSSTTSLSGVVERNRYVDGIDNFYDDDLNNDLPITQGQFIYYTIWLFTNTSIWIPAGYATTLMPENRGSQENLLNILPRVFTTQEQSPTGVVDENSTLAAFLKGFSFTYDQLLTYASLTQPSYGKRKTPPFLLPLAENNLGLYPERGLPYRNQKKLVREAIYLFQDKGTLTGIQNWVEAMTNYNPTVTVSPNLMLDTQDSSFTKTKGRWASTYGTLTAVSNKPAPTGTNAVDTVWSGRFVTSAGVVTKRARNNNVATITTSAAHGLIVGDSFTTTNVGTDYNVTTTVASVPSPTTITYANSGINENETTTTGTISNVSTISLGRDNPVLNGTPVEGSTSYKISFYAASDSNGNIRSQIFWYDYLGAQIGSPVEMTALGTTGVYQRTQHTATSPANAVYCGLRVIATSQNSYNFDLFQIAPNATATNFDEARCIDIYLEPRTINICGNPSFETNITGWTTNSSTSRVGDTPSGLPGTFSLQLSGQNNFSLSSNVNKYPSTYKLTEGNTYVVSMYIKASSARTMTLTLTASDDDGVDSETNSSTINVTTSWARYYTSLYIPEGLSTNGNITLNVALTATLTGQTVWVDNVLVEQGFLPSDYFDGSLPSASGVFWSGTAHASYSYYYQSRAEKMPRVVATLKDWIPYQAPYRIRSVQGIEGTSAS